MRGTEADKLYTALTARGFALAEREGVLVVTPGSALTDEDRAAIRDHKAALLDLLALLDGWDGECRVGITSRPPPAAAAGGWRTVEQELDDLAAWAIAWNRENTESGRREQQ